MSAAVHLLMLFLLKGWCGVSGAGVRASARHGRGGDAVDGGAVLLPAQRHRGEENGRDSPIRAMRSSNVKVLVVDCIAWELQAPARTPARALSMLFALPCLPP